MRRLAYISLAALIIIAAGLALKFDGFKVLAVLGFVLSVDLQIIAAIRYAKMRSIMEALENEYPK